VDFAEALDRYGFRPEQGDRGPLAFGSARLFVAHPNPFLTYHVHTYDDGTALFTWEFAIGEYLATKGIQFCSDETLNQLRIRGWTLEAHKTLSGSRLRSSRRGRFWRT
jgi:hypothetical protein